jgi:hypothetical protein
MRHAARLDTYRYGADGFRHRSHAGLFLGYAAVLALPALVAAVASRRTRALSLVATAVVIAVASVCEAFVSLTTWH